MSDVHPFTPNLYRCMQQRTAPIAPKLRKVSACLVKNFPSFLKGGNEEDS